MRRKYDSDQQLRVLRRHLDGAGINSIARHEGVSAPLIIKWLRGFAKTVRARLNGIEIPEDARKIEILEVDEMFTFVQKKLVKPTFGLPLTGTGMRLLILR